MVLYNSFVFDKFALCVSLYTWWILGCRNMSICMLFATFISLLKLYYIISNSITGVVSLILTKRKLLDMLHYRSFVSIISKPSDESMLDTRFLLPSASEFIIFATAPVKFQIALQALLLHELCGSITFNVDLSFKVSFG